MWSLLGEPAEVCLSWSPFIKAIAQEVKAIESMSGWIAYSLCRKMISAEDVCLCVRCVHLEGACQRNYFSVSVPHWETGRNRRLR